MPTVETSDLSKNAKNSLKIKLFTCTFSSKSVNLGLFKVK